jgi:hypothetical protein
MVPALNLTANKADPREVIYVKQLHKTSIYGDSPIICFKDITSDLADLPMLRNLYTG